MKKFLADKIYTLSDALEKVRNYCAYQERSQMEVRNKLYSYKLTGIEVEQGIVVLIEEGFINEERFAKTYARGKFRIKNWGRIKIKAALKLKQVSPYCIKAALAELNESDYHKTLKKIIANRSSKVVENNIIKKNMLVARYAISQGFEPELVWDMIKS